MRKGWIDYMQKSIDNQPKIKVLGRLNIKGLDIIKRIYSAEGLAPTLSTMMGGAKTAENNRQEKQ